jgi:anti-anti-sigma factor
VIILLVSEAVGNAVQHGRPPATLRLVWDGTTFCVEVRDAGVDSLPVQRRAEDLAESGRGIALVDALADNWGVEVSAASKALWFELHGRRDDDADQRVPLHQTTTVPFPLGLPAFRVDVLHQDGSVVVGLVGELDGLASDALTAELRPLLTGYSASQVAIDCAQLHFVDGGGLRTLLRLCRELEPDGQVEVRNPPRLFRRLTELLDPQHRLDIEDDGQSTNDHTSRTTPPRAATA